MLSDLRRYPRYFLPSGLPARLATVDTSIVDLSLKGARLQTTEQLAVGAKMDFALTTGGGTIKSGATVLWCQMAAIALDENESDRYLAGVVFDEALTEVGSVLDQLISNDQAIAIQDSRSSERYSVNIALMASFGDETEVRINDVSIRGARIMTRQPIRIGTIASLRFRLEPGPSVDVKARVMWCHTTDRTNRYNIGLSINGEESLFRAVIAQMCMRKEARVDLNSLRRKFDPLKSTEMSGLVALAS